MILNIITPDKAIIQRHSINHVNLRLSDGYPISIYPGHASLVALFSEGKINFQENNLTNHYFTSPGLLVIDQEIVSCYVNWAESPDNQNNGAQ